MGTTVGTEGRQKVVEYLRRTLVGPKDGSVEEIEGTPLLRYMMGMLFPRSGEVDIATDGTLEGNDAAVDPDSPRDESVGVAKRAMPSSVGISFLVRQDEELEVEVSAAIYEPSGGTGGRGRAGKSWRRSPLPCAGSERYAISLADEPEPLPVLGGRASLRVNPRPWDGGTRLLTVTLVNAMEPSGSIDPGRILFQVSLAATAKRHGFLHYPHAASTVASDQEEAEVRYLYRDSPLFARGHGAAAMWEVSASPCRRVWVDFMPTAEVRSATFEIRAGAHLDQRYRELDFLSFASQPAEVQQVLRGLAEEFGAWIASRESEALLAREKECAPLAARCKNWRARMDRGIECLSDGTVFRAFQLANQAMLWQMAMARHGRDGPFSPGDGKGVPPLSPGSGAQWRPFQVAFMLGVLESLVRPASSIDREIVDVIWFPTGGGKTEAYLLVAAFELVRRRLANGGKDPATGVLSRYTLRMLTTQQFQRTGMLACALELLRRRHPRELGEKPFSVGLWVGRSLTPNKFGVAEGAFNTWDLSDPTAKNPFLVDRCPACGTSIVDHARRSAGVDCGPSWFRFRCLSDRCEFANGLPMQVVDEALYRDPPSILLGTLDKFAGLAWDPDPSAFLGPLPGGGEAPMPPSLVIQDELHLISGPLGSIVGPYEVALDVAIRARTNGVGAKLVASTATIRNSREQVAGLYGRTSTVFPSPVRTWEDAFFFSLEDPREKPGRLYVGTMGQGATTPVVAMVWTVAALLQSNVEADLHGEFADAYWTVLVYLNSRRELGRTITAASQEIPDRMKAIAKASDQVREVGEVMELSSQMSKDMGEAIRSLQRKGGKSQRPVGLVPCTSIISVGVDVDRLGVMIVNGQPKSTAEYIQASSRVGRSPAVPGLVVTLYSPAKPRDRSHYEDFLAYHEAFYRFVEPTSVTPYAPPARERTLHAALVALIRHATPFSRNADARRVDFASPDVSKLVDEFRARIKAADPSEAHEAWKYIDDFIALWVGQAEDGGNLHYESPGAQFPPGLIRDYGKPPALGYKTAMRSVRNVDQDVGLMPVEED